MPRRVPGLDVAHPQDCRRIERYSQVLHRGGNCSAVQLLGRQEVYW